MNAQTAANDAVELVVEDKHDKSRWLLRDPGMSPEDLERVQQALLAIIGGSVALSEPPRDQPASAST
jgi:anti-sigma regulatory factor (Ser/Thr protein kinase)